MDYFKPATCSTTPAWTEKKQLKIEEYGSITVSYRQRLPGENS